MDKKVYTKQEASIISWYTIPAITHWIRTGRLSGMYYQQQMWPKHVVTYISQEWLNKLIEAKKNHWLKRGKASPIHNQKTEKKLEIARKNAINALYPTVD